MTDSRRKPLGTDEDVTRDLSTPAEKPGTAIDRYKLLQLIGEGGFGSVYMAEQERPVRRKVALKIIKLGMDTRQVIARFEAERQALALMDHPNIARVLDAGSTEKGRPYFVMELVRGVPITEYCDTNGLTTGERLDLFLDVCGAIQHAHQKGIIHRDVKPSNVLVTLHDGKPVPKVIDFGIAKATNQRLTEKTLFTEYRQFIGTPQYMSPEQAEMSGLDVDTRADIYSLGVLLYELLTGTTPFDPQKLRSMAFSEIHRHIRDEDPQKPSTRVSTMGEQATTTAKHRRTDARSLRKALSGDLDWIVMKALEKDRTRRYDTANALIQDIGRHRRNEPVAAGPPGAAYRARKFLRRNRTAVAVAGVVAVALLAGVGAATYGFWEANRERAAAQNAAAEAESVNAFFADMLAAVNPMQLHLHSAFHVADLPPDTTARFSHDVSVAEMVERSAARARESFRDQPQLEATVCEILGTTLLGLNEAEDALQEFRRARDLRLAALGPEHVDVLRSRIHVAAALKQMWAPVAAQVEARSVMDDLVRIRGEEDPLAMYATSLWATLLRDSGQMIRADSVFAAVVPRQEKVLGADHRDTLFSLIEWAHLYCWQGDGEEALKRANEAYERARAVYSPDDAIVLRTELTIGISYAFLGRREDAQAILIPSYEKHRRVYGDEHPETELLEFCLARAHDGMPGEEETVVEYYRRSMRGREWSWVQARDLSRELVGLGRVGEALTMLREQTAHYSSFVASADTAGLSSDASVEEVARVWRDRVREARRNLRVPLMGALALAGEWDEQRQVRRAELDELRQATREDGATALDFNQLAWQLLVAVPEDLRDPVEAQAAAEKGVALLDGESDGDAGLLWDTLATARRQNGDRPGALDAERRSVEALRRGDESYSLTLSEYTATAVRLALDVGDEAAARQAIDGAAQGFAEWFGNDPAKHAKSLVDLGNRLADRGYFSRAEEPLRRAVEVAAEGSDAAARGARVQAIATLAYRLGETGRAEEASRLADEGLALYRELWVKGPVDWRPGLGLDPGSDGERTWEAADAKGLLARALMTAGRLEEAETLHDQALWTHGWSDDGISPRLLSLRGRTAEAERAWWKRVARCWTWGTDEDEPWTMARYESGYARCLMELGRWDEAEVQLRRAHARLLDWCGPASVYTRRVEARLAALERRELDPWSAEDL